MIPCLNPENGIAGALHHVGHVAAIPTGQDERLIVVGLTRVQAHGIRKRTASEWLGRSLNAYFALEVDGLLVHTSKEMCDSTDWDFPEVFKFAAYPSSRLKFVICRNGKIQGSKVLGEFEAPLLKYLHAGINVPFTMQSEDSPGSSISIAASVDPNWQPIANILGLANDRVKKVEMDHNSLSLVREILRGLHSLCSAVEELAKVHSIVQVVYVFLASIYRTVEKQTKLDDEVKAIIQLMKDVLDRIEVYRGTRGAKEEQHVFDVFKVLAEGAARIDEWNHIPAFERPTRAPELIADLQAFKKALAGFVENHSRCIAG